MTHARQHQIEQLASVILGGPMAGLQTVPVADPDTFLAICSEVATTIRHSRFARVRRLADVAHAILVDLQLNSGNRQSRSAVIRLIRNPIYTDRLRATLQQGELQ